MPDPKRRVTIKEVAAQAGVSVATISRVLNGKGPVREATSRRVMETCQALRFTPHGIARSLSLRRTHTIGLLLPDLHGEFFSEVIRGIDTEARRSGYHLLVSGFHSDRQEMIAVFRAVRGRVDGLIVMSPDREAAMLCSYLPSGFPVVLLNGCSAVPRAITVDNYGGAQKMVRHLQALGHTRIAFIKGPEQNEDAAERLRGYRESVVETIELEGDFSEEAGYAAGANVTAMRKPTAIFAANDAMAVGALSALRDGGVRVPHDIALAGFDDIPIARFVTPPLTTVSADIAQLGRRAFDLVIHEEERHEILPATLVIRESCGSNIIRGGAK
ncbi:MAG TPA: LacI family DNA-binding transcriptional regulator [Vicinamibacterales bacterium]|nr:LacI family DNA-binding transcriptional regulator [Thermoanaerobaculia bacterium]HUK36130.1 LacI family DNA-binding transcriptional regulator [Vicinamibacterales bacterium]